PGRADAKRPNSKSTANRSATSTLPHLHHATRRRRPIREYNKNRPSHTVAWSTDTTTKVTTGRRGGTSQSSILLPGPTVARVLPSGARSGWVVSWRYASSWPVSTSQTFTSGGCDGFG